MMMMEWPTLDQPAKYFTSTESCSCPDWRFRGRQRPCKHILRLREALDVLDANRRKWASIGVYNCQHSENIVT